MRYLSSVWFLSIVFLLGDSSSVQAICGKIDIGPAYAHIALRYNNHTIKKLDMGAVKGTATIVLYEGWCVKPSFLYGKNSGEIGSVSLGFGRCLPISKCFSLTPTLGLTYSTLSAPFHSHTIEEKGMRFRGKIDEKFRALSPYACVDISYTFAPSWRVNGYIQYAFSWSKTRLKVHTRELSSGLSDSTSLSERDHSSGPDFGIQLERDINKDWSVNIGACKNWSLRNHNGLRSWGCKLGIVRWF